MNVYHRCQWHRWTPATIPCHGFSVIAGVIDTGDKFLTGVNDTGEHWTIIAGDNYTGDKFIAVDNDPCEQLSLVTMPPAINSLPVTRTRTPWRWGAAKDRRKLKGINRWYLRLQKLDMAADGVIGTAMKSCIYRHPRILIRGPWGR